MTYRYEHWRLWPPSGSEMFGSHEQERPLENDDVFRIFEKWTDGVTDLKVLFYGTGALATYRYYGDREMMSIVPAKGEP